MKTIRTISSMALILFVSNITSAQTTEKGPWWPHPLWGAGDQAGSSNWITPEKVVESIKLVEGGKIYDIGQVYESGMPLVGDRVYSMRSLASPTGGPYGSNQVIYNDDFLSTEIGQVGTQFDGPGHIGTRVKFDDGSVKDVYYNGFTGDQMYSPYGLRELGVEHIKPIITRGILIDIAGYKGVANLPGKYEVSLADIRGALERQGLSENDIRDGDAIFFRYGWSIFWDNPEQYNKPAPGIGMEVGQWVVEKNAAMVGSDQSGLEVGESPVPGNFIPVHQLLITQNGIWNLENLNFDELAKDQVYQFLFIFTPVRFKGATGSPGRPIAIK